MIDRCPKCDADLMAGEIPEKFRQYYRPPYRFSRVIALYDRDRDLTTAYQCPDCNHTWPRDVALTSGNSTR